MEKFEIGDAVEWNWGEGTATGKITEKYTESVTKTLDGTDVTRNASAEEPAYLIEQADGGEVLKSHSEVSEP
jgi:hypothetical protein